MKALKRIIIGTILVFSIGVVVFLGLSLYAYNNLKYYSVYYAQQMPHKEGTEPDLVMLIENMGSIYTPKIEGIRYDDDGNNAIENTKTETVLSNSMGNFLYHKNRVTVDFDSTFRFFHVTDLSGEQPKKEINEAEIKQSAVVV